MHHLPDKEGVILQLNGLDSNTLVVERGYDKPGLLELVDIFGVHLVTVSVTLLDNLGASVHATEPAPFRARLEVRCARAESHRAAHLPDIICQCLPFSMTGDLLLRTLRHEDNDLVL